MLVSKLDFKENQQKGTYLEAYLRKSILIKFNALKVSITALSIYF